MSVDGKKKSKEKVRFEEETVWMSLEDFQKGRGKDLHDIKNLRIEQDFNLSKPEDCKYMRGNKLVMPLEGYLQDEELVASSTRKLKNKEELQKIQYKKVIDGLDLWNNELKAKKRLEAMSELQFLTRDQVDYTSFIKKKQTDPELDMRMLNSIISVPEQEMKKSQQVKNGITNKKNSKLNDENEDPFQYNKSINIDEDEASQSNIQHQEKQKRNSLIMSFPKSLSQIPNRPVTLTSLKMKNVDDFKHKTVSRYVIDEDNKVVMKTDAQLQAEQNNQIINQIFKHKLSKIIESEKPQSKKEYEEIVNNQTALFKKDTLAHFKSLHYLHTASERGSMATNLRDPSHPKYGTIEYKKLYSELYEDKLIKKNIKLEKEKQNLLSQTKYLDEKEKNLLISYKSHSENCRTLKESLNKMRVLLNINSQQKKSKIEELKAVGNDYDKEIRQYQTDNVNSVLKQLESKQKRKTIFIPTNPFSDQVEMLKEKKLDAQAQINRQIVDIDQEQKEIQEQVEQTQNDYQKAKEKKNEFKYQLKQHYTENLNKEITEMNPKSLIFTIIKLFNIKEQITYNIFPEYLEEKNIQYLIQVAKLEQEKGEKQATIRVLQNSEKFQLMQYNYNQKIMQKQGQKQRNNSSISFFSSQTQVNPTSQFGLESTTKLSQIKKPVFFFDNKTSEHQIAFQIDEQPNTHNESTHKKQSIIDKQLKEIKEIEGQIKGLFNQIEEIKQKEFDRLSLKYLKESKDCKNIFCALFGYVEGERFNYEFERRRAKIDQLINANKTFQFSQAVGPQANLIVRKQLDTNNISNQSNRNMSASISIRNIPYQLTNGYNITKNRSSNSSLTENILDSIKNNQHQQSLRKSMIGQIKSSVDLQEGKEMIDAFQLFSPRIAPSIRKKIIGLNLMQETGTMSVGVMSPRTPNGNAPLQSPNLLNENKDKEKKGVTFHFSSNLRNLQQSNQKNNTSKQQFDYQNPKQIQQKTPFLSSYFSKDEKNAFSNILQSPINKGAGSSNFQSPFVSDSKSSQIFESDQQQQNYKKANFPKSAIKVSNFTEDSNMIKQSV